MKKLVASVAAASTLGLGVALALQNPVTFELRSRNDQRVTRRVDTSGGVRLVREFGGDCRRNIGWGFTRSEVWVARNCQAQFQIGGENRREGSNPGWGAGPIGSWGRDGNRQGNGGWGAGDWRNEDWRNEGWRRDDRRGDEDWRRGDDDDRRGKNKGNKDKGNKGRGWGRGGRWGNDNSRRDDRNRPIREVELSSNGFGRGAVRLYDAQNVRLVRELSRNQCGRDDWGWDRDELWVDNGCSARFEVVERRRNDDREDGPWNDGDRLTLTARNGGYTERRIENRGVRLVRELSRNECREGQTWGFDNRKVWVDRGCSAIFEVRRR